MGFLEAGCGWLPDLMHAFHEHWEKRIRDFDPDTRVSRREFARELLRERGGSDGKRQPRSRKLRQGVRLCSRGRSASRRRSGRATRSCSSIASSITIRSTSSVAARCSSSFESDDPAPAYLRDALGPMGEDLACFSADYGHWDGVLTDCVKNVVRARDVRARRTWRSCSPGNCLRFYGERLASRVASRGAAGPDDAFVLAPAASVPG